MAGEETNILRLEEPKPVKHSEKELGSGNEEQEIDEDDLCAICHLLLYKPVTTRCNHTLCESCMAHWADVSVTTQMTTVGLDDEPIVLLPTDIETRCPMCRTSTAASLNEPREAELKEKYPELYKEREDEEREAGNDEGVETLTLYIGNTHSFVRASEESHNKHEWNFFIRPDRSDVIEEVHVFLHPTFRNPRLILQHAPFEVRRLGWGYFTIHTHVILKVGYSWVSSDAEDAPDGGEKGMLPLEWTLDFDGQGSQGRCRLKIKKEKDGQETEDAAQREAVRRLWHLQRVRDPDWEVEEN